jgi:hypothetical protein
MALTAYCLAAVMFFEARDQPKEAMIGVAQVAITLAADQKQPVCKAVKPGVFSWQTPGGKRPKPKADLDKEVYQVQVKLAKAMVRSGLRSRKLRGKYHYFNTVQLGRRFKTKSRLVRIGDLVFY